LDGILVFSSIKKATGKTLCTGDVLDSATGRKEKREIIGKRKQCVFIPLMKYKSKVTICKVQWRK